MAIPEIFERGYTFKVDLEYWSNLQKTTMHKTTHEQMMVTAQHTNK